MKRTFVIAIIVFLTVATVGYVLWLVFDACYTIYKDRRLAKELDELEEMARQKKLAAASTDVARRTTEENRT